MGHVLYPEAYFREKLLQERRRAERTNKPLVIMVVNAEAVRSLDKDQEISGSLSEWVNTSVRGTDICGLLKDGKVIGVILTEVEPEKIDEAKRAVAKNTKEKLTAVLGDDIANHLTISFQTYPDTESGSEDPDLAFYPEVTSMTVKQSGGDLLKRSIDILGSLIGLAIFLPFFTFLPIIIKLTSRGPVIFSQERVGRNGRKFKILKFRSMYLDNDDVIHREYVKKLIEGKIGDAENTKGIYKIEVDPRITPIGRYIRKYSLDELPQFFNILRGDMSLVGPRPPIRYEVEQYCGWQRNRLMGKRPGLTGLWQVTGRSTTSFDEMVRLDLRYLNEWTVMLDLKILLRTPLAMLKCKGAY